ncbi:MAG: VOC family protein [Gemmatimonadaceae bacterium]
MTPDVAGVKPPGFRLPDATHVGRVRLQVADLDRSIAYYEKVIGLSVLDRSEKSASIGARGDDSTLVELEELKGARPVPRRGLLGLYHFAVLLPDRPSLGKFVAHLGALGERAGMSDHLVSEAIYLTDPDGLGIEVYADRPASAWRVEDGQIAMATKPLDVDNLVAAAGGETWSGAPNGTKMGHVHFHVGDIVEAERFYHEALGLDKIVWGYPGALFMSAGGYHHHVGTNTWAAGSAVASDNDARLLFWDLVLPDSDSAGKAAESVEAAGFDVASEGGIQTATDSWGIKVRLLAA